MQLFEQTRTEIIPANIRESSAPWAYALEVSSHERDVRRPASHYPADMEGGRVFPPADPHVHRLSAFSGFKPLSKGKGIFIAIPEMVLPSRALDASVRQYYVGERCAVGVSPAGDISLLVARGAPGVMIPDRFEKFAAAVFSGDNSFTGFMQTNPAHASTLPVQGCMYQLDRSSQAKSAMSRYVYNPYSPCDSKANQASCVINMPEQARAYLVAQVQEQSMPLKLEKGMTVQFGHIFNHLARGCGAIGVRKVGPYDEDGMLYGIILHASGKLEGVYHPERQAGAEPSQETFANAIAYSRWGERGLDALRRDANQGCTIELRQHEVQEAIACAERLETIDLATLAHAMGGYRSRVIPRLQEHSEASMRRLARQTVLNSITSSTLN